jgi:hypothetical protein
MSKKIVFLALLLLGLSSIQLQAQNSCDIRTLKNELLRSLKPEYKYDSFKSTRFIYKNEVQIIEMTIPLFKGHNFRFLLNTDGLPKGIEIKFHDKKQGAKNRKELFAINDTPEDGENIYSFEPTDAKKIVLSYIIPRTTKQNLLGCMVLVIGYNTK